MRNLWDVYTRRRWPFFPGMLLALGLILLSGCGAAGLQAGPAVKSSPSPVAPTPMATATPPYAGPLSDGDLAAQSGKWTAARDAWQRALELNAPAADVYPRLALAHQSLGNYQSAAASLQALAAIQPLDVQSTYRLGLLLAVTEPEDALPYLAQAGELNPSVAPLTSDLFEHIRSATLLEEPAYTFLMAGRTLAAHGEWPLAEEAFRRATQLRPDYAEAWAFLGEARQQIGNDQQSGSAGYAELQKAITLDPQSVSANTFMAFYWKRHRDYQRSVTYINLAIAADPKNPPLLVELGNILVEKGDLPEAEIAYRAAIDLAPDDSAYYVILADFSLSQQTRLHEVALPAARQAVLLAPNDAASLDVMGRTLYLLDDLDNAERFLLRAVAADPAYALAHLHLGEVYLLSGESSLARQHIEHALALAPGTPVAGQAQRLIEQYFP